MSGKKKNGRLWSSLMVKGRLRMSCRLQHRGFIKSKPNEACHGEVPHHVKRKIKLDFKDLKNPKLMRCRRGRLVCSTK